MELTTKVDCRVSVSATLRENGELSVKVFGQAEYAKDRTATAEVSGADLPPAEVEAVKVALGAVLESASKKLGPRVARAIHKSVEVAAAHGEI